MKLKNHRAYKTETLYLQQVEMRKEKGFISTEKELVINGNDGED